MNLQKEKAISAIRYVFNYAREVDRLDLASYLLQGEKSNLIDALSHYQNADGGFGKAIEPDFRVPDSSVTATTVAFNYLIENGISEKSEIVRNATEYLLESYQPTTQSWPPVCDTITNFPRAGWWESYPPITFRPDESNWGNPNLQVVGILNHYSALVDASLLSALNHSARDWLNSNETAEGHALVCAVKYCDSLTGDEQRHGFNKLSGMIEKVIETDPSGWKEYKPQPVWYVRKSNSPLVASFPEELEKNVDFVVSQQEENGSWQPTWSWGRHEEVWPRAKAEWAGHLTASNLKLLVEFGRIDKAELIKATREIWTQS